MSADTDRICPECMSRPCVCERTAADRYACPRCSEIHERVCARIAADRIAALEAELAEERDSTSRRISSADGLRAIAERELNRERAAHERTKAERDAAQADLEAWRTEASLCRDEHGGYESIAARVSLLEAVVQKARGLRWVHPSDRARYEAEFDAAVAPLDAKDPK